MLVALPSAIAFGVTIYGPLGGSLAGHGALAGILGATILGMVVPAIGGTPRLITAPSAPVAAMLLAAALQFSHEGMSTDTVLLLIGMIGAFAGVVQIVLGLFGVGRLIRYLPYPVVSGFSTGVALMIIASQIPKFLGAPTGDLFGALAVPSGWVWQCVVVGVCAAVAMVVIPRMTRKVPAPILALMVGISVYLALGQFNPAMLSVDHNPLLIGPIPETEGGFFEAIWRRVMAIRSLKLGSLSQVMIPALTLAALLSVDTLKTCVLLDTMAASRHDPNRELIGQGVGNLLSAIIGGLPGSGTSGATLVNVSSGGTTVRSSLLAGIFALAAYLLLSRVIAWVPVAALASILIIVGLRMVDRHGLTFFFAPATRFDFAVILAVVAVAISFNLVLATFVGVLLSILLFIRGHTRATIVRNRIEGQALYKLQAKPLADSEGGISQTSDTVIFELQGNLFFGTAAQLQAALEPEVGKRKYVILSMRRVYSLDVTATHVLEQVKDHLEEHDACLIFCDIPHGLPSGLKMKSFLKQTGVVRKTNKAFAFRQLDEALEWIQAREREAAAADGGEAAPLELNAMPFLADQKEEDLAALKRVMEARAIRAGKKVFKTGGDGDEMFLIRRGMVKLILPIHKKENYHMATCGPGDIIGGIGFISATGHTVDAVALTDTDVYVLHRAGFDALADDHRALALSLVVGVAMNLSDRIRAMVEEIRALRG